MASKKIESVYDEVNNIELVGEGTVCWLYRVNKRKKRVRTTPLGVFTFSAIERMAKTMHGSDGRKLVTVEGSDHMAGE